MRDNFTKPTTDVLAKRVGYLCSNPDCKKLTIGPNEIGNKATSIGIAAHITAAASNGPRYNDEISNEERAHIDNGIWLCSNCATLIDKNHKKFTIDLLKHWKQTAEQEAAEGITGKQNTVFTGIPFLEADLIWKNGGRYNRGYSTNNPVVEFNGHKSYDVSNKPIIYWELSWKFNFLIFNNSTYPAYNISVESVGGEHFTYIDKVEKVNNLPPFKNLDLTAKYSDYFEGNSDDADDIVRNRIPKKFADLILKITYYDDERKVQHATLVKIVDGEVVSTKE